MSGRPHWFAGVAATVALVGACKPIPNVAEVDTTAPAAVEPSCYEGHDGSIAVTFCAVTDQALLQNLRGGRWLPPGARALRAKSPLRYGSDDNASRERASARAKLHNSYMIPHYDSQNAVVGWDLFDAERRLAMLMLDVDERWVLVYADTQATSASLVRASLQRFLDAPDPIETRAEKLYPR